MSKKTTTANATTARAAKGATASKAQDNNATVSLDWAGEVATMLTAAKEKPGSRGDQLQRVANFMGTETPAALVLREAASKPAPALNGAAAIIELSRNVLSKLPKLAGAIASGTSYCSLEAMTETRTGDASVPVALGLLGAGDARQKAVVASASKRYPQGGNAQMPAALEALCFVGIVKRKETGSVRNAEYEIIDAERASKLIPAA